MSEENNAVTVIAITMSILGYVLTLIQRTTSSFVYGNSVSQTAADGSILQAQSWSLTAFIMDILAGIYTFLINMVGSLTGMPEWFNALIVTPIGIIVLMYLVNKI